MSTMIDRTLDGRTARATKDSSKNQSDGRATCSLTTAQIHEVVARLRLVTAPSRQSILLLLADGERKVGDICQALGNPSQPAVSHQLSLLRHGQLIESQRRGRNVYYVLTDSGKAIARVYHILAKVDMSFDGFGRKVRSRSVSSSRNGN